MHKVLKQILFLVIFSLLISNCTILKLDSKKENYNLLNKQINLLTTDKKDTIYIRKQTVNSYLEELIRNKELISRTNSEELKELFNNDKEISYLTGQLKDTFLIDFKKIQSKKVKQYIDPFKRLDDSGNIITDYYYIKIFGSRKYTFSKPVFTSNGKYGMMIVSKDGSYISVHVFNKKNNEWYFFKSILLAII